MTRRRREANKLRNIYKRTKNEAHRAAWRDKANEYTREIAQAKENKWKECVSNADGKSIWKIKDYVTNTYTPSFIPTLENGAATMEQKFAEFRKVFFPKPPPANLKDITSTEYPQEIPCEFQITWISCIMEFLIELTMKKIRSGLSKFCNGSLPQRDHWICKN